MHHIQRTVGNEVCYVAWNVKGKPLYSTILRLKDGLEQQWRVVGTGCYIVQTKQPLLNLQGCFLHSVYANSEREGALE